VTAEREHHGWIVRDAGPRDADHTVLLLPGGLCTGAFFDDLIAEPALADVRFVVTTLPGHGSTRPLADVSMEHYARSAATLAAELGCDTVVGHSLGANVAIEMAALGEFAGPLVLLAPSLSREDESKVLRVLDRLGRVLGHLPFAAALKMMGPAMKGEVPPRRHKALLAEMRRNDPRFMRRQVHEYLGYLDGHGTLAPRLCDAGVPAWLVLGEKDDVGLRDDERQILAGCRHVTVVEIPDAGHMAFIQVPARVAEIVREAVASAAPASGA
jgi:pimeloyl-ACP methyl ester carboxylesterase